LNRPKIILTDPKNTNSPRKAILTARVEAAMESNIEFASAKQIIKKAKGIINTVSAVKFEEKKHPRDPKGKFTKKSPSQKSNSALANTDVRSKVILDGDQGFKDILMGLALGAMAEVHDIPANMAQVIVHQADLGWFGARGIYDDESKEIGIDTDGEGRAMSAIHEIGHWFDYNLSSKHLTEDKNLMNAINNSPEIKAVRGKLADPHADEDKKGMWEYLLSPTEMFARAYSQYVITRCSNLTLKKELKDRQAKEGQAQWEDKNFEAIGREFDRIFKTKKRKKR